MAALGVVPGSVSTANAAEKDIVTTAVEAGSFKTLAAALKAGGLVETLLKPEKKAQLVSVLTYHVVAGKVVRGVGCAVLAIHPPSSAFLRRQSADVSNGFGMRSIGRQVACSSANGGRVPQAAAWRSQR